MIVASKWPKWHWPCFQDGSLHFWKSTHPILSVGVGQNGNERMDLMSTREYRHLILSGRKNIKLKCGRGFCDRLNTYILHGSDALTVRQGLA